MVVRHSPGFEYAAERAEAPTFAEQKWGWRGLRPGEWAELALDSRGGQANDTTTVWLIYLRSYEVKLALAGSAEGQAGGGHTVKWHV